VHRLFEKASGLTETIIAADIEVHRHKGPGLIESGRPSRLTCREQANEANGNEGFFLCFLRCLLFNLLSWSQPTKIDPSW